MMADLSRRKLFSALAGIGAVFGLGTRVEASGIDGLAGLEGSLIRCFPGLAYTGRRSIDPPVVYAGALTYIDPETEVHLGPILEVVDPRSIRRV